MVPPAKVVLRLVAKDWFKMFIEQPVPLCDARGRELPDVQIVLRWRCGNQISGEPAKVLPFAPPLREWGHRKVAP